MPDNTHAVNNAFAKALDFVTAQQTPRDGGVVQKAVEALRDLQTHEAFQAAFAAKMGDVQAQVAKANAPAAEGAVKAQQDANKPPQGGIQSGTQASSTNTTGDAAASDGGANS